MISLVTGKASYNDFNSRKLIHQWLDHPQRLWDAIYETLVAGVETHDPCRPRPRTCCRPRTNGLSDNVKVQLSGRTLNSLGLRAAPASGVPGSPSSSPRARRCCKTRRSSTHRDPGRLAARPDVRRPDGRPHARSQRLTEPPSACGFAAIIKRLADSASPQAFRPSSQVAANLAGSHDGASFSGFCLIWASFWPSWP